MIVGGDVGPWNCRGSTVGIEVVGAVVVGVGPPGPGKVDEGTTTIWSGVSARNRRLKMDVRGKPFSPGLVESAMSEKSAKSEAPAMAESKHTPPMMRTRSVRRRGIRFWSTLLNGRPQTRKTHIGPGCLRGNAASSSLGTSKKNEGPNESFSSRCPREESNLYYQIRNLASYPLNDEGIIAGFRKAVRV